MKTLLLTTITISLLATNAFAGQYQDLKDQANRFGNRGHVAHTIDRTKDPLTKIITNQTRSIERPVKVLKTNTFDINSSKFGFTFGKLVVPPESTNR